MSFLKLSFTRVGVSRILVKVTLFRCLEIRYDSLKIAFSNAFNDRIACNASFTIMPGVARLYVDNAIRQTVSVLMHLH